MGYQGLNHGLWLARQMSYPLISLASISPSFYFSRDFLFSNSRAGNLWSEVIFVITIVIRATLCTEIVCYDISPLTTAIVPPNQYLHFRNSPTVDQFLTVSTVPPILSPHYSNSPTTKTILSLQRPPHRSNPGFSIVMVPSAG